MTSYQEKLEEFARGKRLLRLSRPLRDRADAMCDLCGSGRPRTLWGLKDEEGGRHYFVGQQCLQALAGQGVIRKRYGKENITIVYEEEMLLRGNGGPSSDESAYVANGNNGDGPGDGQCSAPVLVYVEAGINGCRALVAVPSADERILVWGLGDAHIHEGVWQRPGLGNNILAPTSRSQARSVSLCIQQAWSAVVQKLAEQPATAIAAGRQDYPDGLSWHGFWAELRSCGLRSKEVSQLLGGVTPRDCLQLNGALTLEHIFAFLQLPPAAELGSEGSPTLSDGRGQHPTPAETI